LNKLEQSNNNQTRAKSPSYNYIGNITWMIIRNMGRHNIGIYKKEKATTKSIIN